MDGNVSDVNPGILALSSDPDAWREQRRKAMREKIFGVKAKNDSGTASNEPCAILGAPSSDVAQNEAFILKQIMSRKHRREEEETQKECLSPATGAPHPPPEKSNSQSLKERLLEKYAS